LLPALPISAGGTVRLALTFLIQRIVPTGSLVLPVAINLCNDLKASAEFARSRAQPNAVFANRTNPWNSRPDRLPFGMELIAFEGPRGYWSRIADAYHYNSARWLFPYAALLINGQKDWTTTAELSRYLTSYTSHFRNGARCAIGLWLRLPASSTNFAADRYLPGS
jgi:hypothetical protein